MNMNDIKALNATGADGREITLTDDQSSLQVRKSRNGVVSYRVRWMEGRTRKSVTLGRADELTLTQARKAALDRISQERRALPASSPLLNPRKIQSPDLRSSLPVTPGGLSKPRRGIQHAKNMSSPAGT